MGVRRTCRHGSVGARCEWRPGAQRALAVGRRCQFGPGARSRAGCDRGELGPGARKGDDGGVLVRVWGKASEMSPGSVPVGAEVWEVVTVEIGASVGCV